MENSTFVKISATAIIVAIGLLGFVLVNSLFEIVKINDKIFNQFGVISLIIALTSLLPAILQNSASNDNLEQILERLDEREGTHKRSKQQDHSPEGNPGKNIIPSELQEDGDTKTITTQYESDSVTVTSTLKITIRRE